MTGGGWSESLRASFLGVLYSFRGIIFQARVLLKGMNLRVLCHDRFKFIFKKSLWKNRVKSGIILIVAQGCREVYP